MAKLLVLLSLILVGCSTTQIQPGAGIPVPAEHIYNAEYLIQKPGNETVTFTRDKGLLGSMCLYTFYVDRNKVFAINPGQTITISLPPGKHQFQLETSRVICAGIINQMEVTIEPAQPQTFRIAMAGTGHLTVLRIE